MLHISPHRGSPSELQLTCTQQTESETVLWGQAVLA